MADPSPFLVASMLFILLFPVILICWMLVYSRDISKAFSMEGVKGVRGLVLSYANNMSHIYNSSVERTQLWHSLSFALPEYIVDLQTGFSLKKASLALFMRLLMLTWDPPSLHNMLPRYVNLSVDCSSS